MTEELIKNAVTLFRNGDVEQARRILKDVLKTEPKNEKAWLWFLQTFEGIDAKIKAVRLWIKVDPDSRTAREILHKLLNESEPVVQGSGPSTSVDQKETYRIFDESGRPQGSSKMKRWTIPVFLLVMVLFCFSLFYLIDQTVGAGYLPAIFNSGKDCRCTETDAYMLHLQDRVERWNVNRTIMIFAELQGDNSKSIEQLQSLYEEELNDSVPGCLEDVHEIFLSLMDLNIKYLQAVDADDEYGKSKYDLSVEIKLDELQQELERISTEFVCSPD